MTRRLRHFVRPSIDARSLIVPIVLLGAGLAACTSSSTDAAAPTTQPTTTSTPAPTSPPATTAPSSTTTAAALQWTKEELAIIEAYESFESVLVAVLIDPSSDVEGLRDVATPALADSLIALIEDRRASGVESRGTVDSRALEVVVSEGSEAQLRVCRWGRTERIENGQVVIPADPEPVEAITRLTFLSGRWLVDGAVEPSGNGTPCEL